MNISQAKENLISQSIEPDKIDWKSYSNDIPIENFLKNEYGIELKDNFALQAQALKEQQAYKQQTALVSKLQLSKLFNKPKVIGLVGNANEAKSNLIYWVLDELNKDYKFQVYVYGLRCSVVNTIQVHSIQEIEQVKDSILIVDEMTSLFDLDNRKVKAQIENTIRLIFHNNNILLVCGLGENFKKFLSAKLTAVIFKKLTLADLINGSTVKNILMAYKGNERGESILNLDLNEALIFDGLHYHKVDVPYLTKYDTKAKNVTIHARKSVPKIAVKEINTDDLDNNTLKSMKIKKKVVM